MDRSSVEVFLTVAQEGSFRKAANKLGYTQAGISYIIHSIEEDLGLTLFIRERSGVTLSPEGRALLPQIKKIDNDARALRQSVNDLKGLEQGSITVQVFDSVSIHWLPSIIKEFKRDFPGVQVLFTSEEDSAKAEERVLTGEVDCSFFMTDVSSDLDVFPLKKDSLLAIVAPDCKTIKGNVFPVDQLGKIPYIAMKYDSNTGMRNVFSRNNATPDIAYHMDNDHAAIAMASKGLGYCIFPELLVRNTPFDVRVLELDKPQYRTISIGTRSMATASKACLKFIEYTRRWVEENE